MSEGGVPEEVAASRDPRWWLPWAGLVLGIWATLPKFSGPNLVTEPSKEIADHIIPGILVIVASVVCLVVTRRPRPVPTMIPFLCGTLVLLGGFWMLATHVPLIVQAFNDEAPWPATIYHSSPSLAVFGLGLMWVTVHWQDLAAIEAAQQKAGSQPDPGAPS